MILSPRAASEVFSVPEIARAAGVSTLEARRLVALRHPGAHYLPATSAVLEVRHLREGLTSRRPDDLFAPPPPAPRAPGTGIAASGALHAGMVAVIGLMTMRWRPGR